MNATVQPAERGANNYAPGVAEADVSRSDKVELEREGDELRADMTRTLDALERKLSPDQLMERSLDLLRENGSNAIHAIGETVRNHPLPLLLSAAGLIWLTGSVARSRTRSTEAARPQCVHQSPSPSASDPRADYGYGQGDTSHGTVKERLAGSLHTLRDHGQSAGASVASLVKEQPLALGALAVAAGALIGAALPMSEREQQVLGEVGGRLAAKVQESTQS